MIFPMSSEADAVMLARLAASQLIRMVRVKRGRNLGALDVRCWNIFFIWDHYVVRFIDEVYNLYYEQEINN